MQYLLTLMLVLSPLHIYALFRRGQSRDRASEPESKPRRGFFHSAQPVLRALAAAFLWRTVRGRLRPGRFLGFRFLTPVRFATLCRVRTVDGNP